VFEAVSIMEKAVSQIKRAAGIIMHTKILNELCTSITDCPHSTPTWINKGKLTRGAIKR